MKRFWPNEKHWHPCFDTFENFIPDEKGYDFIYCSHMLYHVDLSLWPRFLKKVYDSLTVGGVAVITLCAAKGGMFCLILGTQF